MNTRTLRAAVAAAFPTEYSRWTWRTLLPDFVAVHAEAFIIRWTRYRNSPDAEAPALPPVARLAMTLLAKRQKIDYAWLARSHFVQLHQTTALLSENEQLRSDLAKALQLIEAYDNHSTRAVDYLQQITDPDPDNRPN